MVFPELVVGRLDGYETRAWTLQPGSTRRGEASCDLSARILEVPLGGDPVARVVRAHELMHARVSPFCPEHVSVFGDIEPRALECAEELRVNTLVGRLGFDVSLLRDGSEKHGGRRLAEAGDWSEAACFLMAVLGTGAEKEYLAGVRQGRATWLPGLRALRKRAVAIMDDFTSAALGATRLNDDCVPSGYASSTVVLARVLSQTMAARPPECVEDLLRFRRSLEPGGRRTASGRFAPLTFDDSLMMVAKTRRAAARQDRPSISGPSMKYPSRLLTDDMRRAFVRRARTSGGIVIIDQSGSMDLDADEMANLLRRAPDSLVVGYSHRPGDRGSTPNAWILASRGVVAQQWPVGNVGNGVDGPILEWAVSQRHAREPIVWVTDGQVTDSHDHPSSELTDHCTQLLRRHRIRLVRQLSNVGPSLRADLPTPRSQLTQFGRLGRRLLEDSPT